MCWDYWSSIVHTESHFAHKHTNTFLIMSRNDVFWTISQTFFQFQSKFLNVLWKSPVVKRINGQKWLRAKQTMKHLFFVHVMRYLLNIFLFNEISYLKIFQLLAHNVSYLPFVQLYLGSFLAIWFVFYIYLCINTL